MTARQSRIANWIAGASLAVVLLCGAGTGVWWAATISAKVDSMQETLAYLKNRIDGAPPAVAAKAVERERLGRRP